VAIVVIGSQHGRGLLMQSRDIMVHESFVSILLFLHKLFPLHQPISVPTCQFESRRRQIPRSFSLSKVSCKASRHAYRAPARWRRASMSYLTSSSIASRSPVRVVCYVRRSHCHQSEDEHGVVKQRHSRAEEPTQKT